MTNKQTLTPVPTIWNGPYQTWDEACSAAKSHNIAQPAFASERWLQRIKQQLLDYRNEFKQYAIAVPPRPSNLPWVVALASAHSIVDFGGSSGWAMDYLQNTLTTHKINSYTIVELESVVEYMQNSGLHGDVVNYQTLDNPLEPSDLLYCNSVLQYFESNATLLSLIESTTPEYIFLEDLYAKGEKNFFGTQNYYDQAMPVKFIGLGELLMELSPLGYQPLLQCPYSSPIHGVIKPLPMENYPETFQLHYSLSILLKKAAH
jgi:putative methyltransferase (TIGR04325 family)